MIQRKIPVYPHALYDPMVDAKNFGERILTELENDLRDDASITSSISDFDEETIDYEAVYTLHIFIATLEGQISVIRGEKLNVLDDTNAYWWLVKVVKTSEIGYIPAEITETPFERLARFNKYKNIKISSFPCPGQENNDNTPSFKKVSLAKNVSVQSMIIISDTHGNHIGKHFQVQETQIDDPLLKKQNGISMQQPKTRLSNQMLSIGLTQHFMQTRGTRLPPTISSNFRTNQVFPKQPKLEHITSSNLSTSSTCSGTMISSPKEHISVLRVFAGNISVKATFNSVLVNENTTAEQLLVLALERFRLLDNHRQQQCNGVEYYITVKVSDGDEITLSPQDKPLAMFHSLNAHLTTPMPSLTHIRSTIQLTRIGVTKSETNNNIDTCFGQNSVTRFSLNKRIKRINEQDGCLRIKIAYDEESPKSTKSPNITTTTSRFARLYQRYDTHQRRSSNHTTISSTPAQQYSTRIEKFVAVHGKSTIHALTELALEKFHIQQSDGNKTNTYVMTLVIHGKVHILDSNRSIMGIMNDKQFNTNGNLDCTLFTLKRLPSTLQPSPLSTTAKQTDGKNILMATMINNPPLSRSCTIDTKMTDDGFDNSDISLTPTSTSTSTISSDSSRSLTSPCSTVHSINSFQQGEKITTDALLKHIDMTLSNLEQNESVKSGVFIGASSIESMYSPDRLDKNIR